MVEARRVRIPLHPMFTHFPVALWVAGFIFDLVSLSAGNGFTRAAFYSIELGCLFALPTAIAGVRDYTKLPEGHPAKAEGLVHGLFMLVITLAFIVDAWLQGQQLLARHTSVPVTILAGVGVVAVFLSGWLGHRLVWFYGANVRQFEPARQHGHFLKHARVHV